MPTAAKRRKLAAPSPKTMVTRSIHSYSRVSKAITTPKSLIEKNSYVTSSAVTSETISTSNRKRKVLESDDCDLLAVGCDEIRLFTQQRPDESSRSPQSPHKDARIDVLPPSIETPTKGAGGLLDRLSLASKNINRSPLSDLSFSSNLDASTPKESLSELPIQLLDLINLQISFLTALSIHYAHNGTHAPADLRTLCPDVARTWGKRRVLLEDVRRTLGVLNRTFLDENHDRRLSRLSLSDYGHGKVCVEVEHGKVSVGRIARPVDEDFLNEIFVRSLKKMWQDKESEDLGKFIQGLPLEPITICSSLAKMSPLLAKGQRRSEDMRNSITAKKEEKAQKKQELSTGPKMTLLERLRAKQIQNSTLPPPPTKTELTRRAALGKMEEIAAVLSILSTSSSVGQSRISFTFPTVLGKLRDSVKTPISKQEADECVRLLAQEITPEWLRIVKMGKAEALLVNRDEKPGEETVRARIKDAMSK